MASSSSTIGQVLSREDARVADTAVSSELDWREMTKEELLKDYLVPLVPELNRHDVNGHSDLEPAAIVKLIEYLQEVNN